MGPYAEPEFIPRVEGSTPLLTLRNTCAGLCVETVPTNKVREYTGLRPEQRCITLLANRSKICTVLCFKTIFQYLAKGKDTYWYSKMAKTQSNINQDKKQKTSGTPRS